MFIIVAGGIGFFMSILFIGRIFKSFLWAAVFWVLFILLSSLPYYEKSDFNLALGVGIISISFASHGFLGGIFLGRRMWGHNGRQAHVRIWEGQDTVLALVAIALSGFVVWGVVYPKEILTKEEQFNREEEEYFENIGSSYFEAARSNVTGTLSGYIVSFPVNPRLSLSHQCPEGEYSCDPEYGKTTNLNELKSLGIGIDGRATPIQDLKGSIVFRNIWVEEEGENCGDILRPGFRDCVPRGRIDFWCQKARPDLLQSIWCAKNSANSISFESKESAEELDVIYKAEPTLARFYADTKIGPATALCWKYFKSGSECILRFEYPKGISVELSFDREQIMSQDPIIAQTIVLVPEYWKALTQGANGP